MTGSNKSKTVVKSMAVWCFLAGILSGGLTAGCTIYFMPSPYVVQPVGIDCRKVITSGTARVPSEIPTMSASM